MMDMDNIGAVLGELPSCSRTRNNLRQIKRFYAG